MRALLSDLVKIYRKENTIFDGELIGSTSISFHFTKPFYVEVISSTVNSQTFSIHGSNLNESLVISDDFVVSSVLFTDVVALSSSLNSRYKVRLVSEDGSPVFAYKLLKNARGRIYKPQDQMTLMELGSIAATTKFLLVPSIVGLDDVIEINNTYYSVSRVEEKKRGSKISHYQVKLQELKEI